MNKEFENQIQEIGQIDTGGVTFDDREFVSSALKEAGAEITDGGFGTGGADIGFRVNGKQFNLNLKERKQQQAA